MNITDFSGYRHFVLTWLSSQPNRGHGMKSQMADYLRCKLAYVSRVLSGQVHFTPEQALRLAHFMKLTPLETKYFRLMVDCERASSEELRKEIFDEMNAFKKNIHSQDQKEGLQQIVFTESQQSEYYASWHVSAIHMALTIPGLNSCEKLARDLSIPLNKVQQVLDSLTACHLIEAYEAGGATKYRVLHDRIHGDPAASNANHHLCNWRQKAIENIHCKQKDDYHYSAVVSLSSEDYESIRQILRKAVKTSVDINKTSEPKHLAALNIDWFKLNHDGLV